MIIINTFGEFSVSDGNSVLTEQTKRSRKMWTLLQYFIAHHDREISQNELIELLWPEGDSDNPTGALKTQLHRLRNVLETLDAGGEIIVSALGTYAFNNKIDYTIDFDVFEELIQKSGNDIPDSEKLELLMEAIRLYKGDFLHKSALDSWVVPINAYYHARYIKAVHEANELLLAAGRKQEIIDICRRAIIIDPLDERVHLRLIKMLAETGDLKAAADQYRFITQLYYNQGITPSEELVSLYSQTLEGGVAGLNDISAVRARLNEKEEPIGAFFCEFEFFKHVYQLEMRDAARSKKPVHLCILTLTDSSGNVPDPKLLSRASKQLIEAIRLSLRASDVFTRSSAVQFALLLPNTTDEMCGMVIQRIAKKFKRDNPRTKAKISSQYELLQTKGF